MKKMTKDGIKITPAIVEQLDYYIELAEKEGSYYGPKKYFLKRHYLIKLFVNALKREMGWKLF